MYIKNYIFNIFNKIRKQTNLGFLNKPFIATTRTTPFYLRKMQKKTANLFFRLKNKALRSFSQGSSLKKKSPNNSLGFNNNLFKAKTGFLKDSFLYNNFNYRNKIMNFFLDYFDYIQKRRLKRLKFRRKIYQAVIYLKQTSNNYFITVTNEGKIIFWLSSGLSGFSGPKRSTPFAAEVTTRKLLARLKDLRIKHIKIVLQSPFNYFIDSSLKIFKENSFFKIKRLVSQIPKGHNGVRKSKKRSL